MRIFLSIIAIALIINVGNSQENSISPASPTGSLPFSPIRIINPIDPVYGAKFNALSVTSGSTVASSATFTRGDAGTFSSADANKTIVIDGAGVGGAPLITTLPASPSGATATLMAPATYTVSASTSYLSKARPATAQSGAGSYVPGDTVTMTGGTCALQSTVKVTHTTVVSATVAAGGSGGTTSTSALVTGTTGSGMKFKALVTVAAGAISAVNSIQIGGDYTANPTTITAEPVVGAGLTGATLNLKTGVLEASISQPGNCTSFPASPVAQGSTNGSGTGATFTLTSTAAGTWFYGTDDTAAIQAAVTASIQDGTFQKGACIWFPPGSTVITAAVSATANDVCIRGTSRASSVVYFVDSTGIADAFAFSGTNGRLTFTDFRMIGLSLQTAGAMMHFTDSFDVRIYDVDFGNGVSYPWNIVRVDCSTNNPNKLYLRGNQFHNANNDGVYLNCPGGVRSMGDVYIEGRNYIQDNAHAAIEMQGNFSGVFIVGNTLFRNGYSIYADGQGISGSPASNTIINNDMDTDYIWSAYFNGLNASKLQNNHVFQAGIFCTGCVNVAAGLQEYVSTTTAAALILAGTVGWTDAGSHFSGNTLPFIAEAEGTTASADISMTGFDYAVGSGAFATFVGPTSPTLRTTIIGQIDAAGSCISNTGGTTNVTNPLVICGNGIFVTANGAAVTTGDIASFRNSSNANVGVTITNASNGASATTLVNIGNNTSAQEVVHTLNSSGNSGGNGTNSYTINGKGSLFLQGGGTNGIKIDTSGNVFVPSIASTATTSAVCANTSTGALSYDGTLGTCTVSDERLKNIGPRISGALSKLLRIDGFQFTYKDPTIANGPQIGVGAQHVEKVFPELIGTDTNGVKSVAYEKLTAPIIEALREIEFRLKKMERALHLRGVE